MIFVDFPGTDNYDVVMKTVTRGNTEKAQGMFLCGVGLMEAFELAYAVGFFIMDPISEPLRIVHLHNILVQKGYIH